MKKRIIASLFVAVFAIIMLVGCIMSDVNKPVFENLVNGQLPELEVSVKGSVDLLADVIVNDDVDGKIEAVVDEGDLDLTKVGEYTITYTAVDKAGNVATATRVVKVVDKLAPMFKFGQQGVLPVAEHLQYTVFDLLAGEELAVIDNYDQELSVTIKDLGNYNPEVAGEYTIVYEVKDNSGNAATATRLVTVHPAIKYTISTVSINGDKYAVQFNNETALQETPDGLALRVREEIQMMTKDFYVEQVKVNGESYKNGGVPFLPYGVAVVLDADLQPVLVRNATYAIEAIKLEDGSWGLYKDSTLPEYKLHFNSSNTKSEEGSGILSGDFESYIPEGGYVLLIGSPYGGAKDLGKIFLISHLLDSNFAGGALAWDGVELRAPGLLAEAKFEYKEEDTTIYPKPADMPAPVLKIEKTIISWAAVEGAKAYELYVNGELKATITGTEVSIKDLDLEPSAEGEHYNITVKAISRDIRYYGDSPMSEALEYVMPNAVSLQAPEVVLEDTVLSWNAVEGANGYAIYAQQLGEALLIAETTELSYDLLSNKELNELVFTAQIKVIALGDQVSYLDSEASNSVIYYCGNKTNITFSSDGRALPVIVTTAADYFARRNDATELGYSNKPYLYLIKDAANIKNIEGANEAYSFLVLLDKDQNVKAIINILTTTKQYYNGEWVDAASINYTSNGVQIAPILSLIEEGDQLLIGKNGGKMMLGEWELGTRDVLANYYWGAFTADTVSSNQPWRSTATITEYPTFTIKEEGPVELAAPVVSVENRVASWEAIEGAVSYEVYFKQTGDAVLLDTVTTNSFDLDACAALKEYIFNGYFYVIAKGDGKKSLDSEPSKSIVVLTQENTIKFGDDTNELPVVVTTAEHYFANRNDTTELGYANKPYLYLIKDAANIKNIEGANEAYSFLVLLDKDQNVKAIINILTTTKQYYNGEWVDAASINYTSNGVQIAPILSLIEEGDQLLIGKNGGKMMLGEWELNTRDILVHYYWGEFTADTVSSNQPWRYNAKVATFPKFVIK